MKTYASKLLLFGEYTIINGSRALAIPYERYAGHWAVGSEPDDRLLVFADYLAQQESLLPYIDTGAFYEAVREHLFFDSNIPIGYGLGSSGALCAAVYDRFARNPIGRTETERFEILRRQLATMEGHFHGSSSGTDPLICYVQHPVLIHPQGTIALVDLPVIRDLPFPFFLLDTQISRSTGPLVRQYLAKCEEPDYADEISAGLIPRVNAVIDDFLLANWNSVGEGMQKISEFQWEHFQEMIPASLKKLWENGLVSGEYALKLCGAGGGGFLLGTAKNEAVLAGLNNHFPCAKIW